VLVESHRVDWPWVTLNGRFRIARYLCSGWAFCFRLLILISFLGFSSFSFVLILCGKLNRRLASFWARTKCSNIVSCTRNSHATLPAMVVAGLTLQLSATTAAHVRLRKRLPAAWTACEHGSNILRATSYGDALMPSAAAVHDISRKFSTCLYNAVKGVILYMCTSERITSSSLALH